jgi:DMSO/TMAO reductase YedYZ molybdopterin-dependent catalytic subunit
MSEPKARPALTGPAAEQEMRRLTRRSFATGAVAALAGLGAWGWLTTAAEEDGVPWPLRRMLRFNQGLAEGLFSSSRLAPTFPAERAQGAARTNGLVGLAGAVAAGTWQLRVEHEGQPGLDRVLPLGALRDLARVEQVTELRCVEGWSEVMHFGGVRFLDLVTTFRLGTRSGRRPNPGRDPHDLYRYVYLATPDEGYHVGLDMASALHPQTLLCDTMNGRPLTREHGAPLRLYLAVKYGYKSLKRVALIRFQDTRPADYWAERGYDWYAGL